MSTLENYNASYRETTTVYLLCASLVIIRLIHWLIPIQLVSANGTTSQLLSRGKHLSVTWTLSHYPGANHYMFSSLCALDLALAGQLWSCAKHASAPPHFGVCASGCSRKIDNLSRSRTSIRFLLIKTIYKYCELLERKSMGQQNRENLNRSGSVLSTFHRQS